MISYKNWYIILDIRWLISYKNWYIVLDIRWLISDSQWLISEYTRGFTEATGSWLWGGGVVVQDPWSGRIRYPPPPYPSPLHPKSSCYFCPAASRFLRFTFLLQRGEIHNFFTDNTTISVIFLQKNMFYNKPIKKQICINIIACFIF